LLLPDKDPANTGIITQLSKLMRCSLEPRPPYGQSGAKRAS
jgi:hypothetical protein